MSELIAVRCHACNVGMKIKPEYAGKLRKCPKCGEIFIVPQEDGQTIAPPPEVLEQIRRQAAAQNAAMPKPQDQPQEPTPSAFAAPSAEIVVPEEETIHPVERPKRLDPHFRYVILNSEKKI